MTRRYSTFIPRVVAGLIDGFIFFPLAMLDFWIWNASIGPLGLALWFSVNTFAYISYSILLHGTSGQTIGKRAMNIRVLDVHEGPASMKQAILRDSVWLGFITIGYFLELPGVLRGEDPMDPEKEASLGNLILGSGMLIWTFLEFFTMLFNRKRRAIHDFIAGTVVVRED